MARGIAAFVMIASLILSMGILGGIGYYAELGVQYGIDGQNEDVQAAADDLSGVDYDEDRSPSILQGPLAAVIPFVDGFLALKAIIGNTSGVLQLLFGLPAVVADSLQLFFRIAMLVTLYFAVRGSPL